MVYKCLRGHTQVRRLLVNTHHSVLVHLLLSLTVFIPPDLPADPLMLDTQPGLPNMKSPKKPPTGAATVVGGTLAPLTLPSKAESVVSITSQCSYSSTIVHVGDKKPQPESGQFQTF